MRALFLITLVLSLSAACITAQEQIQPAPTQTSADLKPYDMEWEKAGIKRWHQLRNKIKKAPGKEKDGLRIEFMNDDDFRIRLLGIDIMPKEPSVPVMEKLIDLLGDPHWWVRENAGEKLYPIYSDKHISTVEQLIKYVDSPWPEVRANAILALANVEHPAIVDAIKHRVNDPDGHVRAHTLMALGKQGGEEAGKVIFKATSAPNAHNWVTWYGMDAMVAMKSIDKLKILASPDHPDTRVSALMKLMKLGVHEMIPEVLKVANDPAVAVLHRSYAVSALKKAEYEGDLPEVPKVIQKNPETPDPGNAIPKAYADPKPWAPRLVVNQISEDSVYIGWSVTASDKRMYTVKRLKEGGKPGTIKETSTGSYIDTGLEAGAQYNYQVLNEEGKKSPIAKIKLEAAPPQPALMHSISNADYPIVKRTPGRLQWVIEWNLADLDNDGMLDFMVGQIATKEKRAYAWDGKLLWQRPYTRGSYWTHPVRMVGADLDNDGRSEMVCFEEYGDSKWLLLCDGPTGKIKAKADMTKLTGEKWERRDKIFLIDRDGSGYENTIVFAHNTYGCPQIVAFDAQLKHLWTYASDWAKAHKTHIIDLDRDGKDEMILGGDCINSDGTLRWKMPSVTSYGHADLVTALDYDPQRPGLEIAAAGCDSGTAWMVDWTGQLIWQQFTGHAQWLVGGKFQKDAEACEFWVRRKKNEEIDDRVTVDGKRLGEPPLKGFHSVIDWDGDLSNGHEVLMWNGSVYNPATKTYLFEAELKGPKRVADVIGDSREEIILINEADRTIEIYGQPTENPNPRPDRFDNGWWRYRSEEGIPYGRGYINPPS